MPEQYGISADRNGPGLKPGQPPFDPVGISVDQQQLLPVTFPEQFPRRGRTEVAVSGHMDDRDLKGMGKQFGIFRAVTEMQQAVEWFSSFAGFQGQREVPV